MQVGRVVEGKYVRWKEKKALGVVLETPACTEETSANKTAKSSQKGRKLEYTDGESGDKVSLRGKDQ